MSATALSIFVFGIYVICLGFVLLFIPNTLLTIFKFEKTNEPWIRILGLVLAILGFYYIVVAQNELTPLFWASIIGRFSLFIGLAGMVLTKKVKPAIMILASVDAIGALWTLLVF